MKEKFEKKAIMLGRKEYAQEYYNGHIGGRWVGEALRILVDLWIDVQELENNNENYQATWLWIEAARVEGRKLAKKEIQKENRANNRRLAKERAEAKMTVKGFGL